MHEPDFNLKRKVLDILREQYNAQSNAVADIEPRLTEYFHDLTTPPRYKEDAMRGDPHPRANIYELLCGVKFLRLLRTYDFDHRKVRQVVWLREGNWHQDLDTGRWVHDSDGLKCPGTDSAHVYRWQPFQVFVLASVFGFKSWVNTQVPEINKSELLSTERVRADGMVEDSRRLCNHFVAYMPRKCDKTGLSAYIQCIFYLMEDYNAEVYCCAMSETQSKILYNRSKFMLGQLNTSNQWRMTEKVVDWKPQYRAVRNSSIIPLTAGGKTKDGAFAALVNWDEMGSAPYVNQKSDMQALVNVMRSSMGPRREPLTFGTTTAGVIQSGPFIEMLNGLHNSLLREIDYYEGTDTPTLSGDRSLCLLLEPDPEEQRDEQYLLSSQALRAKVNKMLGITCQHQFYEDCIEDMHTGKMTKAEVVAKLFNVYQSAVAHEWIKAEQVRPLQRDMRIDECTRDKGWVVFTGLDFSQGDDLHTASYLAARKHPSGRGTEFFADCDCWVKQSTAENSAIRPLYEAWERDGWLHYSPGQTFEPSLFINRLDELLKKGVQFILWGYDKYQSKDPINALKAYLQAVLNVPNPDPYIQVVSQLNSEFNAPTDDLYAAMFAPVPFISFSSSPLWPFCFGNCVLEIDSRENKRPVKRNQSDSCKIDPVQALIMALDLFERFEGANN